MYKVKLVAESLQEWDSLDEGLVDNVKSGVKKAVQGVKDLTKEPKGLLSSYVENKNKKYFVAAYSKQINSTTGLKDVVEKLSDESLLKISNQSLEKMKADKNLYYPKILIQGGKIVGGGAVAAAKSGLGSDLGA